MFVPLTVLALADLLISIQKRTKKLIIPILLTGLILTINIVNVNRYVESIKGLMAIPNIDQFVKIVQQTHPDYVYGEYGLVQGISYLSGIPMLAGVSETNRKLFLSGVLDKDDITAKLLKTKTTIIAYSDNDNLDIATQSAIVNWQTVKNTCKSVYAQEFRMNPPVNKINIVKCF
jgi:hypothetical protein